MERKIADIGLRIYGHTIDLVIIMMSPILVMTALGFDSSDFNGNFSQFHITFSFGLYIAFTILEGFGGRTPGKYFAKTRVVTTSGHFINPAHSLVRNIVRIADLLFFYILSIIIMWFSKRRQRIGDMVAGTVVIYEGNDAEYDEDNSLPSIEVSYPIKESPQRSDDENE